MRTHGRISTYKGGCRCDACRGIAAEYNRRYRTRSTRHTSGTPKVQDPMRWAERAACRDKGNELFFSNRINAARAICEGCEVRGDCLAYALRTNQPEGIWGGLSAPERLRLADRRAS